MTLFKHLTHSTNNIQTILGFADVTISTPLLTIILTRILKNTVVFYLYFSITYSFREQTTPDSNSEYIAGMDDLASQRPVRLITSINGADRN